MANTILGRDYVNARGGVSGTVPAFDAAADRNHDGYLSDTEYAYRRGGSDARFEYESRLFYPAYGQMRFATNPADGGFRNWAVDHARRFLASHPGADGLFLDNSYGRLQVDARVLREPISRYADDYASLAGSIESGIGTKWVLANTAGSGVSADPLAKYGISYVEEFAPAAAGAQLAAIHGRGGADGPATSLDGRERLRDSRHVPGGRFADRPADADRGAGVLLPPGRSREDVCDVQRRLRAVEHVVAALDGRGQVRHRQAARDMERVRRRARTRREPTSTTRSTSGLTIVRPGAVQASLVYRGPNWHDGDGHFHLAPAARQLSRPALRRDTWVRGHVDNAAERRGCHPGPGVNCLSPV